MKKIVPKMIALSVSYFSKSIPSPDVNQREAAAAFSGFHFSDDLKDLSVSLLTKNVNKVGIAALALVCLCFFSAGKLFGQGAFTATWSLLTTNTSAVTGAGAASVATGVNTMAGQFIPASNPYYGTGGNPGTGQRHSPRTGGGGTDGEWANISGSVEGQYVEFAITVQAGFSLTVSGVSFKFGGSSSTNIKGNLYYGISPGYTMVSGGTKVTGGTPFQGASSTAPANISYSAGLPSGVAANTTIYFRIYDYNTGSAASGKYGVIADFVISGTTTATCLAPTVTSTIPGSRCYTGTVNLAATASAGTLNWWDAPTGGNNIGTGSSITTASIATTTTYYVDAINAGCPSARTAVVATVNVGPTITSTTPGGTCGTGSASLAATTTAGSLTWWDAPTGGTNIGNGSPVTTPSISATTTYYVDATYLGCTTASRTAVTVTVNSTIPTITNTTPGGTCGNPGTARLAATASAGTLNWWTAPTGGANIGTGSPVTTPSISANTTYYVDATYLGCTTTSRTAVTATINTTLPTIGTVSNPSVLQGTTTADLTYAVTNSPDQYSITYSAAALAQGFVNVSNQPLTSPILLTIPVGATVQAYTGNTITVTNSVTGCTSTTAGFNVTVSTSPPTAYYWVGGTSGNFINQTSWSTTAVGGASVGASGTMTFNSGSILIFDGTDISAAAGLQTGTVINETLGAVIGVGQIILRNNAKVTLTSNSASNFSLAVGDIGAGIVSNGYTTSNPDISVPAGSILNTSISGAGTMTVVLASAATADIGGTLNVNSGTTLNTSGTNSVTSLSGTLNCYGTVTSTAAAKMLVSATGIYNHAVDGGTIPKGTWNTGSTLLISGIADAQSISGHNQTFSKLVWDCTGQNKTHFVLGVNVSNASPCTITDSIIVRRTNGKILQLTSSGGQNDFTCNNYFQYGGIVAITFNTDNGGLQRSLTVNNTFYVTDTLVSDARFQIINNPGGTNNITGRLYINGNVNMHTNISAATLESKKDNMGNPSIAEIWFTGSAAQYAKFSSFSGNIDFVANHSSTGVTLQSNAIANKFKLTQGTFFIASNTLTINDAVSYPAPGTGTIGGSATSNLVMGMSGTAGTLNFAGGNRILKDFTQMAGNAAALGTELAITAGANAGRDSLGIGATLTTNDNLILRSDANGTSRMAKIPVNGSGVAQATIVGKVTVERYLPMNLSYDSRRWRLLTAPFRSTNAPTINAAWQEGVSNPNRATPGLYDPKPGYGTHITRSTTWTNDGFDHGSTNNPSIYYYSAGIWTVPANTNSVKITDNTGCYMLFARGSRNILISNQYVAANPTTLDPKGELNTGDVTVALASSGYQTVGNPYASEIKLDSISFNDTLGKKKTIYLWDPRTLGSSNVGNFITCSGDGNLPATYTYTGNTSAYGSNPGVIESSGAFVVKGNGGNIVFHESDKTIKSSTIGIASRPGPVSQVGPATSFGMISKLYTDLLVMRNGSPELADGVVNTYNNHYSNSIDDMDAPKLATFSSKEKLCVYKEGAFLAIERREKLSSTDTIFLYISKLNPTDYQFDFRPMDFDDTYTALLVDKFRGSTTAFSLTEKSTIHFRITADAASAATDRFYIIFKKTKVNAERSVSLSAALHIDDIALDWKRTGMHHSEPVYVERSPDGNHFTTVANKPSSNTGARETPDQWLDENPLPGIYHYRIRYKDGVGKPAYSNTVNVEKTAISKATAIYPNPVRNGKINLQMGNLPAGLYQVRLLNSIGQTIYTGSFNWQTTGTKAIDAGIQAKGACMLEIISGANTVAIINVLMN